MKSVSDATRELIDYWFSAEVKSLWFNSTAEFDELLKDKYLELYRQAANHRLAVCEETATGALALVILLDQIPLNILRGEPESFATEAAARAIAQRAIEHGLDRELTDEQKAFLYMPYMPYMHSESMRDQNRAIELYQNAGLEENLKFAHHHRDIVKRFGRFPHRNVTLGRKSTKEEEEYLASDEGFKG